MSYDMSETSLRFPHFNTGTVSRADYTQVISHNLSHGGYRRGEPYIPPPKPIIDNVSSPKKVTAAGRAIGVSSFNSATTNMTQSKKRNKLLSEKVVMKIVSLLAAGEHDHAEIANLTGVSRHDVSRMNTRSTQAAINCWDKVLASSN